MTTRFEKVRGGEDRQFDMQTAASMVTRTYNIP